MALKTPLDGKQRRYLRSLGHHLEPVVQVGWQGVTEALQKSLDIALRDHELVKVKLAQTIEERDEVAAAMAEATQSECVQIIGRACLVYRPRPKEPTIVLPGQKPVVKVATPARSKKKTGTKKAGPKKAAGRRS